MLIPDGETKKIIEKIFDMIKQQFEQIGLFNLILNLCCKNFYFSTKLFDITIEKISSFNFNTWFIIFISSYS
jgi:hypothetical protein